MVVLLGLGDDPAQGLARAVGPPGQPHLAADALQHAQAHLELRCRLLQPPQELLSSCLLRGSRQTEQQVQAYTCALWQTSAGLQCASRL